MAGNISFADNNAPPINIKHSINTPISRHRTFISDFPFDSSRYNPSYVHKLHLQCLEVKESHQAGSPREARLVLMAARSNKATQARPVFRLVILFHDHYAFSLRFTGFAHRIDISPPLVLPRLSRVIYDPGGP
jgi:hypothetical protein